jgi:hypothetical protein
MLLGAFDHGALDAALDGLMIGDDTGASHFTKRY